ncbi:hypothetical protein ACFP2T_27170 [Plantactinospora solaniradicis]|uniref:Uncharacterized protein n=1 Tax=Plantactinospora solaniradicis TaxID=1723736 RepID=A0ABW1KDK8_9ACTN
MTELVFTVLGNTLLLAAAVHVSPGVQHVLPAAAAASEEGHDST